MADANFQTNREYFAIRVITRSTFGLYSDVGALLQCSSNVWATCWSPTITIVDPCILAQPDGSFREQRYCLPAIQHLLDQRRVGYCL